MWSLGELAWLSRKPLGLAGLSCVLALAGSAVVAGRGASSRIDEAALSSATPRKGAAGVAGSSSAPAKPATVRVEKGLFKIEVVATGVFESQGMTEVSIRPRTWSSPLVVDRAIELGTPVKKGDILIELDHEKLDRAIEDAEVENSLTDLALKQAAEELPILEKSLPVDLAAALRSKNQSEEDLNRFLEIDRPQSVKLADFSVKLSGEYLEYSKEELRQLEKMYRSKDLTEETEEIILRRQRFQVESSEFYLKEAELRRDQTLKIDLPRQEDRIRESAVKHAIDLEKARAVLPLNLNQRRLAHAKLKHDLAKGSERLADLRHDRDAMTIHAPADGLVYYGHAERGHWTTAASVGSRLRKGGTVQPNEVLITVVTPRPLLVRATVDEKDLEYLTTPSELKGRVSTALAPDRKLSGRLKNVLFVPRDGGKFDAVIALDPGQEIATLKPGMACTVRFVPYRKQDALTLPATAVFEDDSDDTPRHHVYLAGVDPDGKHLRRRVAVGKTADRRTEIKDGLAEGDEVLQQKP
jgi:multidrug efflux pump subunit AcrA (membrane-fusion protein)